MSTNEANEDYTDTLHKAIISCTRLLNGKRILTVPLSTILTTPWLAKELNATWFLVVKSVNEKPKLCKDLTIPANHMQYYHMGMSHCYMFFLSNNNKYTRTGHYLKNTKRLIDTSRLIMKVYPESFKQQFRLKNNLDAIVQLELVYTKVVKSTNLDFILFFLQKHHPLFTGANTYKHYLLLTTRLTFLRAGLPTLLTAVQL